MVSNDSPTTGGRNKVTVLADSTPHANRSAELRGIPATKWTLSKRPVLWWWWWWWWGGGKRVVSDECGEKGMQGRG